MSVCLSVPHAYILYTTGTTKYIVTYMHVPLLLFTSWVDCSAMSLEPHHQHPLQVPILKKMMMMMK